MCMEKKLDIHAILCASIKLWYSSSKPLAPSQIICGWGWNCSKYTWIFMIWSHIWFKNEEIKLSLKINNLRHTAQNWTSIVESYWIFSKLYLLIYIYIYKIFVPNELFLVILKKKTLINIKSFKLSLPLILYVVLDLWSCFL